MRTVRFLFNDDMARAIVEGRKTVTRRPIVDAAGCYPPDDAAFYEYHWSVPAACFSVPSFKPGVHWCARLPCAPGDILIGRECWRLECTAGAGTEWALSYRATGTTRNFSTYNDPEMGERCTGATIRSGWLWRPSIHMPDWAARIRRRVVSVTVERVQDITEDDAVREGVGRNPVQDGTWVNYSERTSAAGWSSPRESFRTLWDSIYAEKGLRWDLNPWVWRIEFERENVDGER